MVFQAGEIVVGLLAGANEVAAGALLLHQQDALPEQVDEAAFLAQQADRLLESRDLAAADPKDLEEVVVETLRLALLIVGIGPFARELSGAGANFIPAETQRRFPPIAAHLARLVRPAQPRRPGGATPKSTPVGQILTPARAAVRSSPARHAPRLRPWTGHAWSGG